ncbi:transmembrane protein 266-like [Thunnus albacares]|uniref:transmembrane protein 266-like n=1 Tax=Thunnus maccoyii TaxID=8240 RepID=UPI001C4B1AAA|nr:transmembrane protein 266-like [Thunnus maccoyii]XP_044216519.1 transmembrane protein 266-like [Thunnus albacares]
MANAEEMEQAGLSDLEIISQPVEDENQCLAPPVQLVSFGYRDLPLAALDLSLAGSQLLSNADEDENREGSTQSHQQLETWTAI